MNRKNIQIHEWIIHKSETMMVNKHVENVPTNNLFLLRDMQK